MVLTTFVKESPIASFIKSELRFRNIDYVGPEVEQGGAWGYRHQFNIADSGYGVRAAVVESVWAAKMCRTINDANVLCLGQMLWGEWMANAAVDAFLDTKFTEGLEPLAPFLQEAAKKVEAIRP